MPRAGIVTISGKPNAGKSTLLNRLVGQKLAITSAKPQSTRDRVSGIATRGDTQMVFLDTPGLLEPRDGLQSAMRLAAVRALRDADVILYLLDACCSEVEPFEVAADITWPLATPVVIAFNKSDLVQNDARAALQSSCPDAHFISATRGDGVDQLLARITALLPESAFLYPPDDVSAQPLRFFAAECVREAAMEQLRAEMPYALACQVEEYRENRLPVYIRAVLYVERSSQKRILIGHGGSRIREIGRVARLKIEMLTGAAVYLDLWVKVLDNWRRDANALRRLGYDVPEDFRT